MTASVPESKLEVLRVLHRLKSSPHLLEEAALVAKDAACWHGLLLKDPQIADAFSPVPISLLPSLVPQSALQEVVQIQKDINLLMHKVSHDHEFLTLTLAGVASVDPFIKNLLDIYHQVDPDSRWELEFIRSDYLLHSNCRETDFETALMCASYKQVEVNMICIAFAGLGSKMHSVHNYILGQLDAEVTASEHAGDVLHIYGSAMSLAHSVYAKHHPRIGNRQQVVLTVLHASERNTIDQRLIEFESGLLILRRTFKQIAETARLESGGRLIVEEKEVAIVYYRTGYAPPHYADDEDWATRLLLEKSHALKCPSVAHQLSGFKKIQQELSKDEVLKRFVPQDSIRRRMLKTCVGQWDLSSLDAKDIIEKALQFPHLFVLKPNREGGGNNFYDEEMVDKLRTLPGTEHAQEFILMERIIPPFQENYLVRPQLPPQLVSTVSEIGVFGAIIARNDEILLNVSAKDILVRSKASDVNEGGVATGFAVLSSAAVV